MACVYAREIAGEIREHPMFDKNDETRFIAGYIYEMIMGDRDVSESVWEKVLSLLFEEQPVNLVYDLPEECQVIINKMLYKKNVVEKIPKDHKFNHGPLIERYLNLKCQRVGPRYGHTIRYPEHEENYMERMRELIKTLFYTDTTRQIKKSRKRARMNRAEACRSLRYGPPCEI